MTGEEQDRREKLLNEVMENGEVGQFHALLKGQVLAEFRRARWMRQVRMVAALAAVIAALAAVSYHLGPHAIARRVIARSAIPASPRARAESKTSPSFDRLSDDELIASFPSNTCYLAEVDGHKMLVFRDDDLRRRYLH